MAAIKLDNPKRVRIISPLVPSILVMGGVSFALFALARSVRVQWDALTLCGAALVVAFMGYWAARGVRKGNDPR